MAEDVKDKVSGFLKKDLKIFVCGDTTKRPDDVFRQSSIMLLNKKADGRTIYAEPAKDQRGVVDISFDKPVAGGEIEKSTTRSSRDFTELSNVLKELGNVTWVMDKDAILRTFALDTDPNKTKLKAFEKHLAAFSKEENNELTSQLSYRDKQMLYKEVMEKENNPFSLAIPSTTIDGNVGVINPADADMPIHDMFFPYLAEKGIGLEEYNQFINTHEAGHANDRRNHRTQFSDKAETNWMRHRTECVADTFSTLMLARKTGNTNVGELAADVRNELTVQGLAYIQKYLDKQRQEQLGDGVAFRISSLSKSLSEYADDNFEDRPYVGSAALKKFMEEEKAKKEGRPVARKQEPSFVESIINDFDGKLTASAFSRTPEDVLGSIIAYTTTPTVDATIKVAKEKLKDGSLQAMSTKEVYSLAEKMVDENTFSKEKVAKMISSFMKGETMPEFEAIFKRRAESGLTVTDNKKVKAEEMTGKQTADYDRGFRAKIASDSKVDVINAVETEKDRLRAIDPFKASYVTAHSKIEHLNDKYIDGNGSKSRDAVKAKILANKDKTKKAKGKKQPSVANLVNKSKTR
ncbi:MAG: hypothetical protein AB7U85_01210 [Alphaproteobacteria bacterium]